MRKILCGILVLIVCSISIYSYAENTVELNQTTNNETQEKEQENSIEQQEKTESTMDNLKGQQQEIKNQIEKSGNDLNEVKEELTDNLEQIQKIDEKIETSENELQQLNAKIEELNKSITKQKEKLKEATKKYEKQKKIAEARLIAIYETGETEYLDVILSSTDLSDFISSYAMLSEIAAYDKDLLESVEEQKNIMELVDQRLYEDSKKLEILKKNEETNKKILENTKIIRENYKETLTEQEQEIQNKIDEYQEQFRKVNQEILQIALSQGGVTDYIGGEMAWPIPGYTQITSPYGMRTHPITGVYKLHTGVDVSAPMGANFVAANDGIVTQSYYNSAYGNMVMIDHGGGISTLYAHGSEILVEVGQTVTKGTPILKVGSTGYSTGPHAHFEVRINGVVTNPMEYLIKKTTTSEQTSNEE